jgi:hypothetical protein
VRGIFQSGANDGKVSFYSHFFPGRGWAREKEIDFWCIFFRTPERCLYLAVKFFFEKKNSFTPAEGYPYVSLAAALRSNEESHGRDLDVKLCGLSIATF